MEKRSEYRVACDECHVSDEWESEEHWAEVSAKRHGFVEVGTGWLCKKCHAAGKSELARQAAESRRLERRKAVESIRKHWALNEDDVSRLLVAETRPAVIAQWGYTAERAAEELDGLLSTEGKP